MNLDFFPPLCLCDSTENSTTRRMEVRRQAAIKSEKDVHSLTHSLTQSIWYPTSRQDTFRVAEQCTVSPFLSWNPEAASFLPSFLPSFVRVVTLLRFSSKIWMINLHLLPRLPPSWAWSIGRLSHVHTYVLYLGLWSTTTITSAVVISKMTSWLWSWHRPDRGGNLSKNEIGGSGCGTKIEN